MTQDTTNREIRMSRTLNAPVELVWEVWTNPEHIKNWFGPNGFTTTIHKMDIKKDGDWTLTMHGPDGTDYNNKSTFLEVIRHQKIVYEHHNPNFISTITFRSENKQTHLDWHMVFKTREEFIAVVKTFKADQGLRQNIDKLEHYIKTQKLLHSQLKPNSMARTTTYLNFPGNTEEAFNFYKTVFKTDFNGGMKRVGDLAAMEGAPPFSEADKKLIIHVELPILGGHILMATDAPESMGFKLTRGDNMHINLEPDTRQETKRLYEALSAGGKVTMELKDMFWGSYYGSCTDKYGINWMFHCSEK